MTRFAILGMAAALAASSALAPALALAQGDGRKVVSDRFTPFDKAAESDGWASISPQPIFASVAVNKPEGSPMTLQAGSYRVVVLCNCNAMEVTLMRPDNSTVPPERSDDHGAMYSLDVPAPGVYLTGIDMDDCAKAACEVAVKVYRKKDG
jgi:hypothetical protein